MPRGLFGRRQSAPQPTAVDYLSQQQSMMLNNQGMDSNGAMDGFRVNQPIGREEIQKAVLTLNKYKQGKANLENKIIENEQWYKLRHWECMRMKEGKQIDGDEPTSAWLFNSIANKHADAMDNFPSPNILPREEADQPQAKMLSSILPVVLDQCGFEQTYDDTWHYKLKVGTGVYGVFWDKSKLNGLGDISIKSIDLLNLFWEPGIKDIQLSRNIFHVELSDNDLLEQNYPQLKGKLGTSGIDVAKYMYDDTVDTSEKSAVVDWYYHKYVNGKKILHYCKFVNDTVLFATENDQMFADRGWYDHGEYPFVFDTLFPIEGTPVGFGYIDVAKNPQSYIDKGNKAILDNMQANARPRNFVRNNGAINEEEYADLSKDLVHVEGSLDENNIRPIVGNILSPVYVDVINGKIDEIKETTGNRDISTGGTTSGVTAASAIAAMQEAGSKLSRDAIKASYRAFRKIVTLCIELIRQFYDAPRCFRIVGVNGAMDFVSFSNAGIQPQMQGMDFGVDMGYRLPTFDIEVTAQKQSPYSKMAQNELALQFFNAGFFNPMIADQALACLEMMDFERKEPIMQIIAQNAMAYQAMMAQQAMMGAMPPESGADTSTEDKEALGGEPGEGEATNTKKARQRVADSTTPT